MDPLAASYARNAVDITRPHPAHDYYLGGMNNWLADWESAGKVLAIAPEVRGLCRASRAFLTRVVRCVASVKGITQFPRHRDWHAQLAHDGPDELRAGRDAPGRQVRVDPAVPVGPI